MNKTLLVLAASRYQVPVITTAHRLGYRVVTTDNVPANPGHRLADVSYGVDTTDRLGVLRIARQEHISGVIAACTDVAVPTAAYVAEQLGLPGVPLAGAEVLCDKIAFREFLRAHGLPTPVAYPFTGEYEPAPEIFRRGAWISKPDRSSGSKGVFIVRSPAEFRQRQPETLSFSPTGRGILEEFIVGAQGTCEGVLHQGELALAYVLDRQTVEPPYTTTCGHYVPTTLPEPSQVRLFELLRAIWQLLGITDTVFDCDFVAAPDEVYILEMTPRLGGNSISTLLHQAADFDLIEYAVRQACGEPAPLPSQADIQRPTAIVLLGVAESGRLEYDRAEAAALRQEAWVHSLTIDVPAGEPVWPFIHGRHRLGEAVVFGRDRADLEARVRELKQRLRLRAI